MRTDENRELFGLSAPESVAAEAEGAGLAPEEKKFIDAQLAEY